MLRLVSLAAGLAAVLQLAPAHAHLSLTSPTNRYGESEQKAGPCGTADNARNPDIVSYLAPGATITVSIIETVPHPGHFRIAFDDVGDDDFVDPVDANDTYTNDAVLLDQWLQAPGEANPDAPEERVPTRDQGYSVEVTLPDIECDSCTLQVIQVMTDKNDPGVPFDGNDIYYRCANLVLTDNPPDAGGGTGPGDPDAGADDSGPVDEPVGGGCAVGASSGSATPLALLLGVLVLGRRRRRIASS